MDIFKELLRELEKGNRALMITSLQNSSAGNPDKALYTESDLKNQKPFGLPDLEYNQLICDCLEAGELQVVQLPSGHLVLEPFFPKPALLILGGGHIAKPLCELATKLGFSVTVVDDRPSFANKEAFPNADHVVCDSFEKCFDNLQFHPYTYVVIVTRGHRYDSVCLHAIVNKTWHYAGMIGSKRRVREMMKQLIEEGISEEILKKINTPIGLEIGAVTPEEIAISILAQIIAYRRLKDPELGNRSSKICATEFDRETLEDLASENIDRRALVTIISSKGSTPRKAGAKMIVWPDGRIKGSIGGGCSESEVIQTAYEVIRTGWYQIQAVDMTGSVAENEGMVCGGIMEVLIEPLL